jgi:hypothetical protein
VKSGESGPKAFLDGVGVDAVVELGKGAVEVPGQREAAVLVLLETLEFLDEVELKLRAEPRTELEGDILVGVRAALTSGAGGQSFGAGAIDPCLGGQEETVPARLISNSLEFEGIKIRVVNPLPDAQEEDGILVLEPLLDEGAATIEIPHHVGQRDVVAVFLGHDGDGRALNFDGGLLGLAHGGNSIVLM